MKYSERIYKKSESCIFRKTREEFGGLSNMSSEFPLTIQGIYIPSTEALYQACRYPHLPEVQKIIIEQKSPMSAKMKSKLYYENTREDWENVKVGIMKWCIRVKLAQHFQKFGNLLGSTMGKHIVEFSGKDRFWGVCEIDGDRLQGINALGRLLMELREDYLSEKRYALLYVEKPNVENLSILGVDIESIDTRYDFFCHLLDSWKSIFPNEIDFQERLLDIIKKDCSVVYDNAMEIINGVDSKNNSSIHE